MNINQDSVSSEIPDRISKTPISIGFLTYRYGPSTTKLLIGSHGAGVPSPPLSLNSLTVKIANITPIPAKNIPTTINTRFEGGKEGAHLVSKLSQKISAGI